MAIKRVKKVKRKVKRKVRDYKKGLYIPCIKAFNNLTVPTVPRLPYPQSLGLAFSKWDFLKLSTKFLTFWRITKH